MVLQSASSFCGVYLRPDKRWQAHMQIKGKKHDLGIFDDEYLAAHAYDRAAKEAFAVPVMNFQEDGTLNPNRKRRKSSYMPKTSRFRGVCKTGSGRWLAQISFNSCKQLLGFFTDEEEAAKAYDTAAKQCHRWPDLNFPDDEVRGVSAQPPAMVHPKSGGGDEKDLGWSSSDEDEDGLEQQSECAVPPGKRSSFSGAVATASPHNSTATAAAPAMHGQSPIDLTLEDYDLRVDRLGVPSDTSASTPAYAVSSSPPPQSTPTAPSALPASPLASSSSSAAAAPTSSPCEGRPRKSTSDAVEQLHQAVMKARMDAKDTSQKAMLKTACALFKNPTAADAIFAFARRTITNAFGAVDLSIEEQRTTVVEMFIEQLVDE